MDTLIDNQPVRFGKHCDKCGRPMISCVCVQHIKVNPPESELYKKIKDIAKGMQDAEVKKILEQLIQAYNLGYSDRSSKSVPFQDMDPAEYFEQFLKEPPSE